MEIRSKGVKITHENFVRIISEKFNDIEVISEYQGTLKDVIVVDNEDNFFVVNAGSLIRGYRPTIKSCVNKDKMIIDGFRKVHGDKYDYSMVNYVDSNTMVKVVCKIHGEFDIHVSSHRKGYGCHKCVESAASWHHSEWEKAGLKSDNFDGFKVYIIRCYNSQENFFKIGKTFRNLSMRFSDKNKMPYEFEVIKEIVGSAKFISAKESELKQENKEYRYSPEIDFDGRTECYSKLNYLV